jgi:hypothetical protein
VFARSLVPGDLVELPAGGGMPALGEINLVLLGRPGPASEAAKALAAAILASGHPITR